MVMQSTSSFMIYGFVLITGLYFIPSCLAERKLLETPPENNPVGQDNEDDDQSKSGVHSSQSVYDGSASGGTPPSRPPSPTSVEFQNNVRNGGQTQSVTTVRHNNLKTCEGVKNGVHVDITGCNNNGNEGRQENYEKYYAAPPPEYEGNTSYDPPGSEDENSDYP